MDDLLSYLDEIAEPTFVDFQQNPNSKRHAFLACVAVFHAIDRATYPKKTRNLPKEWGEQSFAFLIVDMVAHHLKHVRSDAEKHVEKKSEHYKNQIPLPSLVFGTPHDTAQELDGGIDLHNLYFIIRDAIEFVRRKAA